MQFSIFIYLQSLLIVSLINAIFLVLLCERMNFYFKRSGLFIIGSGSITKADKWNSKNVLCARGVLFADEAHFDI